MAYLKTLMANVGAARRKKDPGRKSARVNPEAKRRVEEVDEEEEEEVEAPEADNDLDDNLTYHEDSLSVMKGYVTTAVGRDVPVWITT